jgi:hypothetical protein
MNINKQFLIATLASSLSIEAWATADGPDYYQVNIARKSLNMRDQASFSAPIIATIPAKTNCLQNLGCQGGLSFEDFITLSNAEKRARTAKNPRWCKVEYQGKIGWVMGRYLAETACSAEK